MTGSWLFPLCAWILAPLLTGIITRVKAFFAGRRGAPVLQPYYDLAKLLRKGEVYSHTSTAVSRLAPVIGLGALMTALCLIPWGILPAPMFFSGDWILLVYLLGVARFVTVMAALDAGSSFEGMGASREVQFAALAEPSFLLGMLVLILCSGQTTLSTMFHPPAAMTSTTAAVPLLLVACAWFVSLLTENCRIPIDDPNTHLELTMIHEVMVLDYSGPELGIILYTAALKLWVFSTLLVNLLLPAQSLSGWMQAILMVPAVFTVAVLVGLVESVMARLHLRQIPKILVGAGSLGAIALILLLLEARL